MSDIEKAKAVLKNGRYTCVLVKNDDILYSSQRGIRPLTEFLTQGIAEGYSAADKVVGNGAAYLYVLLRVKYVYAWVLSRKAKATLDRYGIANTFEALTEEIRNRENTGTCPMEVAVEAATGPEDALDLIKSRLNNM